MTDEVQAEGSCKGRWCFEALLFWDLIAPQHELACTSAFRQITGMERKFVHTFEGEVLATGPITWSRGSCPCKSVCSGELSRKCGGYPVLNSKMSKNGRKLCM
jgi:hypothetical protein